MARGVPADPLTELSAAEAISAIQRGDLRAEVYASALLDRCNELKDLNAFISLDRDAVLEAAREIDRARIGGQQLGALSGLPVPLKDSIGTTALPTTSGTQSLRAFRPRMDAVVWQRLIPGGRDLAGQDQSS